jgi:hypothetical protein
MAGTCLTMPEMDQSEAAQESNASWARRFKGGTPTTNLSQRHRDAIARGSLNEQARDERQFETDLVQNKGLRDLVLRREKADLAERRFTWDQEKQQANERIRLGELDLRERAERRLYERTEREMANARRIDDATAALENDIQVLIEGGQPEGSIGYAKGVMASLLRNPMARSDYKEIVSKGARIKGDPEVMRTMAEANGLEISGIKVDPATGELEPTWARKRVEAGTSTKAPKAAPNKIEDQLGRIDETKPSTPTRTAEPVAGIGDMKTSTKVDAALAQSLIKEAGGDRQKARALARERGYEF